MRNPERMKQMLYVLLKFDGQILTNKLATVIVGELIRYGIYRPMKQSVSVKSKWATTQKGTFSRLLLNDDEVMDILKNNPQNHKEAGFDKGFPSRFATIFDLAKELGFVYFAPNSKIEFSDLGRRLVQVIDVKIIDGDNIIIEEVHPEYEQQVFLQAFAKSQRKNPFVRVLNDNIPLILLLETIKLINADADFNNAGILRKELPLLIFWKDNDAKALYNRIKELRKKHRYNPSDETIIDICVNEIMGGDYKEFDSKSIMVDYTDEFIRKMRMTGLISLRGAGRFIDINHNEDKKVDYVLEHYSHYIHYETEREYFNYMAKVDETLFTIEAVKVSDSQSEKLLNTWVSQYSWESIKNELIILAKRKSSSDSVLKILAAPVRLEFLTAMAIKSKLPEIRVIPNYCADDTGLPTSTAGGGIGDIECIEQPNAVLVEVTMAEGRTQTMMEIWPIERHLHDFKNKYTENSQGIFIAPSIFSDSQSQIDYVKFKSDGKDIIRPYKIEDFISYLEETSHLYSHI